MIVLDASVVIGFLSNDDAHHDRAFELLSGAADEELRFSTITLAESLAAPANRGELALAQDVLADLGIAEVPLGSDAAVRLARLRAETNLKFPDCCVLLAAEDVHGRLASFDDRLRRAARKRRIDVVAIPRASR